MTATRVATAFVLTCISAMAAQDSAVFRVRTDAVLVPVSVTDRNGRFVRGLTSDEFEIAEGGTRRAVQHFRAERVPVSLVVLLDISGSMVQNPQARVADDARWADTRRALALLLTRLSAPDEVLFAAFNEQLFASQWTEEYGSLLETFDLVRPGGRTGLVNAVKQIASVFRMARHQRKVLLLISDGNDTQVPADGLLPPEPHEIGDPKTHFGESRQTLRGLAMDASREAVRRWDAVLYAIGIGTRRGVPVDTTLLDGLTRESGGYTEVLRSPSESAAAVARICDDLQSQYLLTFEPAHADGKYHPIRVKTKDTRLRVRARAGYVAAVSP